MNGLRGGIDSPAPPSFALPGTRRRYEPDRPFRPIHLDLELDLAGTWGEVEGTATYRLERVGKHDGSELVIDAIGLHSVETSWKRGRQWVVTDHRYDGAQLHVSCPPSLETGELRIRYRCRPQRGLHFISPDESRPARQRQIWSQCQDEDARHFIPCFDHPGHKFTYAVALTVPHGMEGLSNGTLVRASRPKGKGESPWKFHYDFPHPLASYLLTIVAGDFAIVEDRPAQLGTRSVPIRYFVPRDSVEKVARSLGGTPAFVELLSQRFAVPYPYDSYTQVVVEDFTFGGMENSSATTLYEHALLDERASLDVEMEALVVHELAHQWFGDLVTCRDWSEGWLNEGFATLSEQLLEEMRGGLDDYETGVQRDLEAYLAEAASAYQRPIVCRDYAAPIDLFDRHLYEKGAVVLHLLRREVGDDAFFSAVRDYLERFRNGVVETRDLQRTVEAHCGRSLDQFFDQWVYSPGHVVATVDLQWKDGTLTAAIEQRGAVTAFPMELHIAPQRGAPFKTLQWVTGKEGRVTVKLAQEPAHVAVDPGLRILGTVTTTAPATWLHHQLRHGATARIRTLAALALARKEDAVSFDALKQVLQRKGEHWSVAAAAARSLGRLGTGAARHALREARRHPLPRVRKALADALGDGASPDALVPLQALATDESYLVRAAALRSLGKLAVPAAAETILAALEGSSWADVVRAAAVEGLGAQRDRQHLAHLLAQLPLGVPQRVRRSAVGAVARLAEPRDAAHALAPLLRDEDLHLRAATVDALAQVDGPDASSLLARESARERDPRVQRAYGEALRNSERHGAEELARLRDELVELRRRLSALEERTGEPAAPSPARAPRSKKGARK